MRGTASCSSWKEGELALGALTAATRPCSFPSATTEAATVEGPQASTKTSLCKNADDKAPMEVPGGEETGASPPTLASMTERFLSLDFKSLGKALERFKFDPRLAVALRVPSQAAGPSATLQSSDLPPPPPPLDFHRVYSSVDTLLAVHEQQALQVRSFPRSTFKQNDNSTAYMRLQKLGETCRAVAVQVYVSSKMQVRSFPCCCLQVYAESCPQMLSLDREIEGSEKLLAGVESRLHALREDLGASGANTRNVEQQSSVLATKARNRREAFLLLRTYLQQITLTRDLVKAVCDGSLEDDPRTFLKALRELEKKIEHAKQPGMRQYKSTVRC